MKLSVPLLLVLVNLLWLAQISLPVLDDRVPSLFSLPVSELLCLPLGASLVICTYRLLLLRSHHKGSTETPPSSSDNGRSGEREYGVRSSLDWPTTLFLLLSFLWAAGVGMHVCAVAVQDRLTPHHSLYTAVHDHLHRLWSHSIFQSGYFGLLLLLSWSDGGRKNGDFSCARGHFYSLLVWSVVMGGIYTVVAEATETQPLTWCFYHSSILLFSLCSRAIDESCVTTSVTVSSVSGLILMSLSTALF